MDSEFQGSSCLQLPLPMLGLQIFFALLSVYVGEVDLTSGYLGYVADTLLTDAFLDPLFLSKSWRTVCTISW